MSITVPYRLANGPGNVPDALQFMANYDFLQALVIGNQLLNPGLEDWNGGTSFTNPADATAVADNWTVKKSGTSSATVDVTREPTTIDTGTYSLKANITGAGSADSVWSIRQALSSYVRFKSETVIFAAKVRVSTGNKARLKITDGVTTNYSAYHDGDGTFQLLQVVLALSSSPTSLTVDVELNPSDFTGAVYIDSSYIYVIPSAMDTDARELLSFLPFGSFFLPLAGGVMAGTLNMGNQRITNMGSCAQVLKKPNLVWNSVTRVDVQGNTGTANQTTIPFYDGEIRSVTENLGSTQVYRSFKITQTAAWASGTIQGGIRTGSEATNTWYWLYAVKCTKAGEEANFVIVGDVVAPTQANYATLNSNFGTLGWYYLGAIRNGDVSGATGDILKFKQSGNKTTLYNEAAQNAITNCAGIRIATSASTTTLTYTYAAGGGSTDIPANFGLVGYITNINIGGAIMTVRDAAGSTFRIYHNSNASGNQLMPFNDLEPTMGLSESTSSAAAKDINLYQWVDDAIGVGQNPSFIGG